MANVIKNVFDLEFIQVNEPVSGDFTNAQGQVGGVSNRPVRNLIDFLTAILPATTGVSLENLNIAVIDTSGSLPQCLMYLIKKTGSYNLPNGTAGQIETRYITNNSGANLSIAGVTFEGTTTAFTLTSGQSATLTWTGSAWKGRIIANVNEQADPTVENNIVNASPLQLPLGFHVAYSPKGRLDATNDPGFIMTYRRSVGTSNFSLRVGITGSYLRFQTSTNDSWGTVQSLLQINPASTTAQGTTTLYDNTTSYNAQTDANKVITAATLQTVISQLQGDNMATNGSTNIDPNTTLSNSIVTTHNSVPVQGQSYLVTTEFYSLDGVKDLTDDRTQIAYSRNTDPNSEHYGRVYIRNYNNASGTWSSWIDVTQNKTLKDYYNRVRLLETFKTETQTLLANMGLGDTPTSTHRMINNLDLDTIQDPGVYYLRYTGLNNAQVSALNCPLLLSNSSSTDNRFGMMFVMQENRNTPGVKSSNGKNNKGNIAYQLIIDTLGKLYTRYIDISGASVSSTGWVNNSVHSFMDLLDKPTTLAGYGITDWNISFYPSSSGSHDWNNFVTPGLYEFDAATTKTNSPSNSQSWLLEVKSATPAKGGSADQVKQFAYRTSTAEMYYRHKIADNWSDWKRVDMYREDFVPFSGGTMSGPLMFKPRTLSSSESIASVGHTGFYSSSGTENGNTRRSYNIVITTGIDINAARGIAFDIGNSWNVYTTMWDTNGAYQGTRRILTELDLPNILEISQVVGMVSAFAMNSAPAGWLVCNGAAVSRTTYSRLFEKVGTLYGAGDGRTTFNLPDYRGVFLRGFDGGRGFDSGRTFGSYQADAIQDHYHYIPTITSANTKQEDQINTVLFEDPKLFGDNFYIPGANDIYYTSYNITPRTYSVSIANSSIRTATETRPKNSVILYCIKY